MAKPIVSIGVTETIKAGAVSLTPAERETVVNADDASGIVRIWTAQRAVVTKLRKHPAFTEVRSGTYGSSVWAEFTIPADQWNPATGAKRSTKAWTPERRAEAAARLAQARNA